MRHSFLRHHVQKDNIASRAMLFIRSTVCTEKILSAIV